MTNIPDTLQRLLQTLQQIPHLAPKNVYKVANYFLEQDRAKIISFCKALLDITQQISRCQVCFTWQQSDLPCNFCTSPRRNQKIICIVEAWPDVLAIERALSFEGVYHVLGGLISPLNGTGPDDLTINFLHQRVIDINASELILALGHTPEGEVTASYLVDKLQKLNLNISVLAQGMPVGSSLEYTDRVTLARALSDRKQIYESQK